MSTRERQAEKDLERALALVRFMRDPALPGMVLMTVLILTGLAALVFAWFSSARTLFVPLQIPALVSGGLGGIALVGMGAALLNLQITRRDMARERKLAQEAIDEVTALLSLVPEIRRRVQTR